jgi:hypothetical protein
MERVVAARLVAPKVVAEVKREGTGAPVGGNANAGAVSYQQLMQRSRLQLGHQMQIHNKTRISG